MFRQLTVPKVQFLFRQLTVPKVQFLFEKLTVSKAQFLLDIRYFLTNLVLCNKTECFGIIADVIKRWSKAEYGITSVMCF